MRATHLAIVLMLLPVVAQAGKPVPMVNPSFEQQGAKPTAPGQPDWERGSPVPGWHAWIGSVARTGKPQIQWASTGGRTGKRCVALSGCIGGVCIIQSVPVEPGTNYEARVWMKVNRPQPRCVLSVRFQDAKHKWAKGSARCGQGANTAVGEWRELRALFHPPAKAAFAVFLLTANGQKPGDTCWFDDASLTELDPGELLVGSCGWVPELCRPVGQPAPTPHVPWATPWAGKRLKVLFLIGSDHNLREPLELAHRMAIDHDTAFAHAFESMVHAPNDRQISDRFRAGYYDVIVIGIRAPTRMLTRLAAKTRGLVLLRGGGAQPKLPPGTKLNAVPAAAPLREPLDALAPLPDKPDLALATLGVGRLGDTPVIQLRYSRGTHCLTPTFTFDEHLAFGGEWWEAWLQLVGRAILTAGGVEASVQATLAPAADGAVLRLRAGVAGKAVATTRFSDRLGRVFEQKLDVTLKAGKQPTEHRIVLPAGHPSGPSTVLVTVRDTQGRSLGFAATRLDVKKPTRLLKAEAEQSFYEAGQPVVVAVAAAGDLKGARAVATLTDAWGRTHARAAAPVVDGHARLEVSQGHTLSTFNWLTVRLVRGKAELDARRSYVYTPRSRTAFLADYQVGTWASSSYMSAYLHPTLHRLMREAAITIGIQSRPTYASMLAGGMELISTRYGRIPGFSRHSTTEPVRKQCVNNPDTRARMAEVAREVAAEERGAHPIFGYIRDETSLVRDHLAVDVCACKHCVARFRDWLRARYTTLAALNRHWHTAYKAWDEIGFTTFAQVRGKPTFAPWVAFRRFQEWAWADAVAQCGRHARQADPTALLALPNTFGQKPFVGRDYWLLAQANDYTMEYPTETRSVAENRAVFDTLRCFNPATRHLPWVGYVFNEPIIRYAPWWTAFHGATGAAVYGTMSFFAGKNSWAQIYPALQHTTRGLMYAKELEELKQGVGKLLMNVRRPTADVAILWSQAAMHIGWALSDKASEPGGTADRNAYGQHFASRRAFRMAVLESWRQYDLVCEEQIRRGALGKYKWLVMPAIYGVDDDVAAAIERFVADGGTVVADMGAGLTNEAGARLKGTTRLTRLLGFTRTGGQPSYAEHKVEATAPATTLGATLAPFAALGRETLKAAPNATVAAYPDGVPALIARTHGKGRTLFLNCRAPDSPALVDLFAALPRPATLAHTKAKDRPAGYEVVRFEAGANACLAVIRDWRAQGPEEAISITLPAAAHVYDIRARKPLGHSARITCTLGLGDARLYALLPYRVTGIGIDAPKQATCGTPLTFACTLATSAAAGHHVVRVDVRRPDGTLAAHYGQNLAAPHGRIGGTIPFALNDPPGRWTLVARDIASGAETTRTVELKGH